MADTNPQTGSETSVLSQSEATNLLLNNPEPLKDDNSTSSKELNNEQPTVEEQEVEQTPETESEETQEFEETEQEESENQLDTEDDNLSEPEMHTINVDGQSIKVTTDELKNSYLRNADYTRKTQAVAEQRKALEQLHQQTQANEQQLLNELDVIEQFVKPIQPDTSLIDTNPSEYVRQKEMSENQQKAIQEIRQRKLEIQKKQQQDIIKQQQDLALQNHAEILELIPSWNNPKVAKQEVGQIETYLSNNGFSRQEIATAVSAKAINIVRKAMFWDNANSKKDIIKKKVVKAPKMAKGSTPKSRGEVNSTKKAQLFNKLSKSGKTRDAVEYLLNK
jgi:hypothetical protein